MYDIPSSVQTMIPSLSIINSALPHVGWTAFQEKALWLEIRFPMYLLDQDIVHARKIDAQQVEVLVLPYLNMQRTRGGFENAQV